MEAATSNRVLIIVFVCISNQFLSDTEVGSPVGGGGGDFIQRYPGCVCVCPKVMDMGPFSAPSE